VPCTRQTPLGHPDVDKLPPKGEWLNACALHT
jgi:hypothetical protein